MWLDDEQIQAWEDCKRENLILRYQLIMLKELASRAIAERDDVYCQLAAIVKDGENGQQERSECSR